MNEGGLLRTWGTLACAWEGLHEPERACMNVEILRVCMDMYVRGRECCRNVGGLVRTWKGLNESGRDFHQREWASMCVRRICTSAVGLVRLRGCKGWYRCEKARLWTWEGLYCTNVR